MNSDNIFDNVAPKTSNHTVSIEFALAEREVWTRAACAVASANDCKSTSTAIIGPTQSLMRMLNVSANQAMFVKTFNFNLN